jgi:hypothetical protein
MIFRALVNIGFAFLGPFGALGVILGDWLLTSYLAAKIVENYVPNGPAIIGNMSEIIPVLKNTAYSIAEPALNINYTAMLEEAISPVANFTVLNQTVGTIFATLLNTTAVEQEL